MFSPPVNGAAPAASVRSSRRRPRPVSSEGSISQPKAKRHRGTLNERTFVPPDSAVEMQETKGSKLAVLPSKRESAKAVQTPARELTVRGKKPKSGERGNKGDGTVTLTANETYTVSRLPAWPDRLQTDTTGRHHGTVYSDTGYALALTSTHAIVWPYATTTPSPETFTFALPHPSKNASDPLPLGSLVSSSASSPEPGLVVVMPSSGRITYWESIATAATLDLIRQQRSGVELLIPGMFSGETVVQLLNAESAGFVLGFSSGRLAYMSVRDAHGRPAISVQFLRGTNGSSSGGLFGSIRNALSSSAWRVDLSAARAAPVTKPGERDIVTVTSRGKLQAWNLHRGGHNSLQAEADGRESIVTALKQSDSSLAELLLESFEVLDFAFAPKSPTVNENEDESESDENGTELLLLTSLSGRGVSHYALVQVILRAESLDIGLIRRVRSYTTPTNKDSISKPRIFLPNPAVVAFIVFDRAVVVSSMARQPDSPELQLLGESKIITKSFEDVIDFRNDTGVEIVGTGIEEPSVQPHSVDDTRSRRYKAKYPAVVLLVKGGGVIRVAVTDPHKFLSVKAPQVTAKSKLEQAVFFGTMQDNPLSFAGRPEIQFSSEEVGEAALMLSHEILSSATPHIPALPVSVDQNLRRRSAALRAIAVHLKTTKTELDSNTRWRLLSDAEKMAAAVVAWDNYDSSLKQKPPGKKHGLWNEIVEYIHEEYKNEPVAEAGELDRVRQYFIKDVYRFEIAIAWAYQVVKYSYQEGDLDRSEVVALVSEADDLVAGGLEAAFDFRLHNLGLYGLNVEIENGILQSSYKDLPQFWTSSVFIAEQTKKLVDLARTIVQEYWQQPGGEGQPDPGIVEKVRLENPKLLDLSCRSNVECFRWCLAQDDPQIRNQGEHIMNVHLQVREVQIYSLTDIGLVDEAIKLAQNHKVYDTLVALVIEDMQKTDDTLLSVQLGEDGSQYVERIEYLQGLVTHYYQLFARDWAKALYNYYIKRGEFFALINDNYEHRNYLTEFLRSRKEFSRLAWINDIIPEKNFDRAAKTLLDLGLHRERDLWCKKVDLSIGKLARLSGRQYSETNGLIIPDGAQVDLEGAEKALELIRIQEKIFSHVYPAISAAIDEKAELQLALEVYGNERLRRKDALSGLLHEKMSWLIEHKAMDALDIIDLLTLMADNKRSDMHGTIDGQEFFLALQALKAGPSDKDVQSLTEKMIWRRCMLRDDWEEINNTDLKDDEQVSRNLERTALFSTLRACFKNGFFEKPSKLQPVKPQEVLGTFTDELDGRYKGLDASVREPLLRDMGAEDDQLKEYIDKFRLQQWFEAALDLAKQDVETEANEETERGKVMMDVAARLKEMEDKIASDGRKAALELLKSKPRYVYKAKVSVGWSKSQVH